MFILLFRLVEVVALADKRQNHFPRDSSSLVSYITAISQVLKMERTTEISFCVESLEKGTWLQTETLSDGRERERETFEPAMAISKLSLLSYIT